MISPPTITSAHTPNLTLMSAIRARMAASEVSDRVARRARRRPSGRRRRPWRRATSARRHRSAAPSPEAAAGRGCRSRRGPLDGVAGGRSGPAIDVDDGVHIGSWGAVMELKCGIDDVGDLVPGDATGQEGLDRDLVGGAQPGRSGAPDAPGVVGQARGRGRPRGRAARSRDDRAWPSRCGRTAWCCGRGRPGRSRSAGACPAARAGRWSRASVNSTIECTTDCGCTTTSIWSKPMPTPHRPPARRTARWPR